MIARITRSIHPSIHPSIHRFKLCLDDERAAAARGAPSRRPPVPRPAVESRRRSFSRKRKRHTLPLIITHARAVYLARCNTDRIIQRVPFESSRASRARVIHASRSHRNHLSFHDARAIDARAMAFPSRATAHTVHARALARRSPVPRRRASPTTTTTTTTTIARARADDTVDVDVDARSRAPTGGAARSFVGASFYDDPYDGTGTTTATATATARGAAGAIGASARRARGAMRPAANEKRRTKNRADEVIERRRRVEREMRSQMVEREVEKEVESWVKKRVRRTRRMIDFL